VKNDVLDSNPQLAGDLTVAPADRLATPLDDHLSSRSYFDLNASYRFDRHLTVSAGINNLFDKDPPLASSSSVVGSFGNGNTYPQVYDSYGRFIYLNASYRF
jgi:iron complex outermembrane receptor protein